MGQDGIHGHWTDIGQGGKTTEATSVASLLFSILTCSWYWALIFISFIPFVSVLLSFTHSAFITAYLGVGLGTLQPDSLVHNSALAGLSGYLGCGTGVGWHGMHMSIHISGIS